MKVECKELKRTYAVIDCPVKTKNRNSAKSLAPRVKRPPNKQYKELKKQGKELFDDNSTATKKKTLTCEQVWENHRMEQVNIALSRIKSWCNVIEEFVNQPESLQKHKMFVMGELGQMTRKITVTAEDIHADNQKKGKK